MFSPPAVAGDHLYAASCSGSVFGLRRADGDFVWVYDARDDGGRPEYHGTSIVTDDVIVIATDDRRAEAVGHVYALDRTTGEPRWKQPFAIGVMTDLIPVGDVLYFATLTEQVVALKLASGEPVWTFEAGSAVKGFFATSTPLVAESRVFFGGIDGTLHALNRETGEKVWSRSLGERVSTALIAIDGKILAGTADNKLHLLEPATGKIVATRDLPGLPFGRPVVDGGVVVFMTGGEVRSLSSDLSSVRWESKVDTEWASFRPVVIGEEILAGADDGRVYALRLKDGATSWSQDFGGPVTSLTSAEQGSAIYIGTAKGIVFATRFER